MSGPRTKRPFAGAASDPSQRQITSFFKTTTTTDTSSPSTPSNKSAAPLNGPVLPAHVQSNLLSVGMRVRKSVVEGYKTDPSQYSAFALWSDPAAPTSASSDDAVPVPAYTSSGGGGGARELAPFCGIHKVGGLAVQAHSYSFTGSFSSPSSSQESNASATSASAAVAASTRKRFFVAEDDESDSDDREGGSGRDSSAAAAAAAVHGGPWRHRDEWIEEEISPRSFTPVGWGNARVLAVPKSQKAKLGGQVGGADLARLGQENMAVDDFEETPFLQMDTE
ncbi:ribonucleotide reductase inhibitor-domain-containing protein [Echria macrotheca]|uniref:Ribonucleotide reductase inhibitor-domain-containing protein n=1 Tax=Echria macrotheca TaxID=438768 RepID=A0AAJ0B4V5_9PEZI|nr:ribonucleotide reductase inhibitor-domain-containing protein [Echria macrotheca]